MQQHRDIMGMPIVIDILDKTNENLFDQLFAFFDRVDNTFSTYKPDSEISRINRRELTLAQAGSTVKKIFTLAQATSEETQGYFDIKTPSGSYDPSGLVKGWAIWEASKLLDQAGSQNYYIEAGGDIQVRRPAQTGQPWRIGIKNPFQKNQIVKIIGLTNQGVATSGSYERGQHIYNPLRPQEPLRDIISLTVIGPNVYEADRFATAAFAMGKKGIHFIEGRPQLAGYQIDSRGQATFTSNFNRFVLT